MREPEDVTVSDRDLLDQRFETHRSQLRAVALRMLGSSHEADDALQETWLRYSRADTAAVENLGGWLITVVARICLDMLRARATKQEVPAEAASGPSAAGSPDAAGAPPRPRLRLPGPAWRRRRPP